MEIQERYIGFLLIEYGPLVINLPGETISSKPASRTDQIIKISPRMRRINARTIQKIFDGKRG
jgi:hypothetical protein